MIEGHLPRLDRLARERPTLTTPDQTAVNATPDPWAVPLVEAARSRIPESFAALRYRDFRLLLGGLFMALSGWWMIIVAQGWLVLEMTDRASAVALVSAMLSLPWLILAPFSGVLADRIYRKHLLLTTRLTVAVLMLVEGVLILTGLIEFWQMVVLAFLAGSAFAMDIPARQSLIPDTVHRSVVANAVAINTSVFSMTTIAGPMVGAGILEWLGPGGCFLANAVGNVCLASAIFLMRIPRRQRVGRMNFIGDFVGGLIYVRRQPLLMMLLGVSLTLIVTTRSWQQIAPVFVRDVWGRGEGSLGVLYTATGIGAVTGAFALLALSKMERRWRVYGLSLAGSVVGVAAFAYSPTFALAVVCVLFVGFGQQVADTTSQTVILVRTPEELRGRMIALTSLLSGLQPLGMMLTGVAADLTSPQLAVGGGALLAALGLLIVVARTRDTLRSF